MKRGKTDRIDAEAICEAASRPTMRFVPVKTIEQQGLATLHRCRGLLVKNRTMLVNALRAHLADPRVKPEDMVRGFVAAKGIGKLPDLAEIVSEASGEALPEMARAPAFGFLDAIALINRQLDDIEKRLRAWHKDNGQSRRLETIPGVGFIGATALPRWFPIRRCSRTTVTSPPGSGLRQGPTGPAARHAGDASRKRATAICAVCSYWGAWPDRKTRLRHRTKDPPG